MLCTGQISYQILHIEPDVFTLTEYKLMIVSSLR